MIVLHEKFKNKESYFIITVEWKEGICDFYVDEKDSQSAMQYVYRRLDKELFKLARIRKVKEIKNK